MSQRDITIDIAKGIGIFLVVLGHVPIPMWLATPIYMFHMPLFFFLSGMFFHPEEKLAYGIYKKVRTLIVPYLFFAVCANGSNMLRDLLVYHTAHGKSIFSIFNAAASPLWFLICLFGCYLLSRLTSIFTRVWAWKGLAVGSLFWGGMGMLLCRECISLPLWGTQVLLMQFYYIIGYVVRQVRWGDVTIYANIVMQGERRVWVVLAGFIACCLPFSIRPNVSTLDFYHPVLFLLGSLSGIYLCLKACKIIDSLKCKLGLKLQEMGNLSLFILGFHFFVIFHLYYLTIPLLMRVAGLRGIQFEGEYLRNSYWVGIALVIPSIWISMALGKFCTRRLRVFFKV